MPKYKPCCDTRCLLGNCKIRENGGCYCVCRLVDHIDSLERVIAGAELFNVGCLITIPDETLRQKMIDSWGEDENEAHLQYKKDMVEKLEKAKEKLKEYEIELMDEKEIEDNLLRTVMFNSQNSLPEQPLTPIQKKFLCDLSALMNILKIVNWGDLEAVTNYERRLKHFVCDWCPEWILLPSMGGMDIIVRPKWISVKDDLPEKYDRVLVTDGKKVCLHYKQSMCNFADERGYDLYCSCVLNHDRCDIVEGSITHWMPLPSPPESVTK